MVYTVGFSPCPNDTFIFDAMVNGKIDTKGIQFEYKLEDVETLNRWAMGRKLDITKLSFNTILQTFSQYSLSDSGSALGRGVGPLLITKNQIAFDDFDALGKFLQNASIAIPGANTTANLLLNLAFPDAKNKTEIIFSDIEKEVLAGKFDCGLVIHESRFTYAQRGLYKLLDMGEWWEALTKAAIPLGGICISKEIPRDIAITIEQLIRESVQYSWNNYPQLSDFVKNNAQEMEEVVMRKHIELYVNEYTYSLGMVGKRAIDTLLEKAAKAHLINIMPEDIYL